MESDAGDAEAQEIATLGAIRDDPDPIGSLIRDSNVWITAGESHRVH